MRISPSLIASLVMTICACFALWRVEKEFSIHQQVEERVEVLSKNLMEEKLKSEMILARLNDFKQEVAMHWPDADRLSKDEQMRDLASVIPHVLKVSKGDELISQNYFKSGKSAFENGKYEEAIQHFMDVMTKYPDSSAQLEASYYLIKTFHLTGNRQEALSWSVKMVSQFPESVWTAKAMLVTADIFIEQKRQNDALDVYQTILNTFDDEQIRVEVKKQLSTIGI